MQYMTGLLEISKCPFYDQFKFLQYYFIAISNCSICNIKVMFCNIKLTLLQYQTNL